MYRRVVKRVFDIFCSVCGLLILSPVLLTTSVLVRAKLGSPVFFRQERPGKAGKVFRLYKFRTMTDKKDEKGNLLPDGERLNRFGRALRAASLDEIPELWNILKGNMSLIGPRPLLVQYLPLYSAEQMRRHNVRPGLTGYAQVNGRNAISWQEKFAFDCWYVDNLSFRVDVRIFFMTLLMVVKRSGVNSSTSDTMEPFTGNS